MEQGKTSSKPMPKAAKLVPFLKKVQMLCDNCPPHVARWSADGKQFDVLDAKAFEDLLRVYFEGASPQTFHRQLFFYGWVKLNHANGGGDEKTKGTWSFRHPNFLRDEPSKIYEIRRYARAADRDEQEDGSRVDILERRVSALQSLVDDLSRKLAAVQLTLDRTPLAVPVEDLAPTTVTVEKPGRKRVKDVDEDLLSEDMHLTEDDILHLFDPSFFGEEVEPESKDAGVSSGEKRELRKPKDMEMSEQVTVSTATPRSKTDSLARDEEAKAQEFLSSFMSTPHFQAVLTSTIQETAQSSAKKAETPAPLRVC